MKPLLEDRFKVEAIMHAHIHLVAACTEDRPHLQKLFRSFAGENYAVDFLGWDRLRERPQRRVADGTTFRYIQRGWGYTNRGLLLGLPLWGIRLLVHLLRVRQGLIYALDLDSACPAALASLVTRRPLVYDIRDNYALRHNWPGPVKALIEKADAWTMSRAAAIVVVDENRVVGAVEQFRDKVLILYNCPEEVEPPSAAAAPRPFTILASGHLRSGRGITFLLDAIERVPGARILMAGRIIEPELLKRVTAHPQVEYRGWVSQEEAWRMCFEADAVYAFYAPDSEMGRRAASNKWFDAMMAAKPILANTELEKAPWIQTEDIGYLCPYGDADALAQMLKHIAGHPDEAHEKGQRARKLFDDQFNWPAMKRKLFSRIDQILRESETA